MKNSDQREIALTHCWLEQVVVGLNLCPFAAKPLMADKVWYRIANGRDDESIYQELLQALDDFIHISAAEYETGLLIFAHALKDFDHYLDFLADVEDLLEPLGLNGLIQLASFHPDYCFGETDADDPANYTNRSPFPMFHFIRESELEIALAGYPDPETIPERNIALLRKLGLEEMRRRLSGCQSNDPEVMD